MNQRLAHAILLDIFRIVLCVGVVIYHYTPVRPCSGPFMVIGFFVMSGFLLGLQFNKQKTLDVNVFYHKKAKRLLPLLIISLLLAVGCKIIKHASNLSINSLVPPYSANEWINCNIAKVVMWYNAPLWYMVVELAMLLFAPLYFVIYKKKGIGTITLLITTLSVSLFLHSRLTCSPTPFAGELYYSTLYRAWQFIGGLAAAQLYCHLQDQKKQWLNGICVQHLTILLGVIFLALSICFMIIKQEQDFAYWNYDIRFDIACVAFYFCLIPLLYHKKITLPNSWKNTLGYAAALTYPMYLIHCLVANALRKIIIRDSVWPILAFVISIIISVLMLEIQKKIFNKNTSNVS